MTNPFPNRANVPDVFGGVALLALLDDGETLCERCLVDPSNPVHDARNDSDALRDGWGVVAFFTSDECESTEICAHCNRVIIDRED
jgi:hypothetical protein